MDTKVKKVLKPITFGDWLQVNEYTTIWNSHI